MTFKMFGSHQKKGSEISDQTSPLLNDVVDAEGLKAKRPHMTPIPKVQLAVICFVRLSEPIAFMQIFPYINEFIFSLNVTDDPKRIGIYSGMVESLFSACQLASILNLGKLSDRIGRRPVILGGVTGVAISTLAFGFSTSFVMLLVCRALAGISAGSIAAMHAIMGENTDTTNQAAVLPLYGLMWPIGSIIGSYLGGTFSHPAEKFPLYFDWSIFREYPYMLPCLVAAVIGFVSCLIGYSSLKETLPGRRPADLKKSTSGDSSISTATTMYGTMNSPEQEIQEISKKYSAQMLLSLPIIRALCGSGLALAFLHGGFEAIFVLYCFTSVENGGIGFPVSQIGHALSLSGIISLLLQVAFLPYLLRKFEATRLYHFCMSLWPASFVLLSTLNMVARTGYDDMSGVTNSQTIAYIWILIGLILTITRFACLSYGLSMLLAKQNSPSPTSLGAVNGLVQSSMCLARAFGPALVSSIFALSVDYNLLGGYLWVVVLVMVSFGGIYQSSTIAKASK